MGDELARALDRVLSLSGGDLESAEAALRERAVRRRRKPAPRLPATTSPSISSVSSITSSDQLTRVNPSTKNTRSRSIRVPPHTPRSESLIKRPQQPRDVGFSPSLSKSQLAARTKSSIVLEITDSESVDSTPASSPTRGDASSYPFKASLPVATQKAHRTTNSPLPDLLAGVQNHQSKLSTEVFEALKRTLADDPFFLGSPEHIQLTDNNGSVRYRKVISPLSPLPHEVKRWYIITRGSRVGIFIDWTHAAPFVLNKSSAVHKSYKTREEAYLWFQYSLLRGEVELINSR